MSIQEIEHAIAQLPRAQRAELVARLNRQDAGGDGAFAESAASSHREVVSVPYERIAHLAGIIKGGPNDLASNKTYLSDLGHGSIS